MKALFTNVALIWRSQFRSFGIWVILILIPLLLIGLPIGFMSSENAISGEQFVLLGYALQAVTVILVMVVLSISCATMARDIESKRFTLTYCKPVMRSVLWLGRWLGCLAIIAVLVGEICITLWMSTWWMPNLPDGQHVIPPTLPPAKVTAEEAYNLFKDSGRIDPTVDKDDALAELALKEPNRYIPILSNQPRTWSFDLNQTSLDQPLTVRLSTAGALGASKALKLAIRIGEHESPFVLEHNSIAQVTLPIDWFTYPKTEVTLIRLDEQEAATLLMRPYKDFVLLTDGISYGANVLRYGLMLIMLLSSVAAIGVTLGIFLSFPVALFTSVMGALALVAASSNYVEISRATQSTGLWTTLAIRFGRTLVTPLQPYLIADPWGHLMSGEMITGASFLNVLLPCILVIPLIALPAILALSKGYGEQQRQ